MSDGPSAALAALHLGHDGPLPAALRDAVRNGGAAALGALRGAAECRHLDRRAGACRIALATDRHCGAPASAVLRDELAAIRAAGLALRAALGCR
jgi:hypothetical protein